MRNKIITLTLVLVSLLIGCSKQEDTLSIGMVGTMSGTNSDLSVSARRGAELAIQEINDGHLYKGTQLVLNVKDDHNDPNQLQVLLTELRNEKVTTVIGPFTSVLMVKALEIEKEILFLGPTISSDALTKLDDNLITFMASTYEQAYSVAEDAKANHIQKFIVVLDQSNLSYVEPWFNNFQSLFADQKDVTIESIKIDTSQQDQIDQLLAKLSQSQVEGLVILSNARFTAMLAQQLHKANIKPQIYGPLWANTPELITQSGDAGYGIRVVGALDAHTASERFKAFSEKFEQNYGEQPTFASMFTYETVYALLDALKLSKDWEANTLKQNIIQIGSYEGLESAFEIDVNGDNNRKYMMLEITEEGLRRVK